MSKKNHTISSVIIIITMLFLLTGCNNDAETPGRQDIPGNAPVENQTGDDAGDSNTDDNTVAGTVSKELTPYDRFKMISSSIDTSTGNLEDSQVDMDMKITMDITMEMMGERITMPVTMTGNIKTIVENGNIQYSALLKTTDPMGMGTDSEIEMYFDGQRGYYAVDGIEIDLSLDEYMEQIQGTADMPEFGENAIKSSETRNAGDNIETTMIIDGEELKDYMLKAMGEEMADLGIDTGIEVSDVTLIMITTKDDIPLSLNMSMEMSMIMTEPGIGEMKMDFTMVMDYIFNKYGSGVEIDLSKLN